MLLYAVSLLSVPMSCELPFSRTSLLSKEEIVYSQKKVSVSERMGILKTAELEDFAEKSARAIRILKTGGQGIRETKQNTQELADVASQSKNPKD